MQLMLFDEIISLCCYQDAHIWKIASRQLLRRIPAKKYTVIVPDQDVDYFLQISPAQYFIEPQSKYARPFEAKISQITSLKISNPNWYIQQFIKLAAIESRPDDAVILLWDGDTVPLKPLQFDAGGQKLHYYLGSEFHVPYFDTVNKLLGLSKVVEQSFIAQCFPIKVFWFRQFCQTIEQKFGQPWGEALIKAINFTIPNSFSEYETLGTFIAHHYPNEIELSQQPWHRLGHSLIGDIDLMHTTIARIKLAPFDYVSFEKWDRLKPYLLKVRIPLIFYRYLKPAIKSVFKAQPFKSMIDQILMARGIIKITEGSGIFSCCTVRLEKILEHFNHFHKTPFLVDSSEQFSDYKSENEDVSSELFAVNNEIHITWSGRPLHITNSLDEQQFSSYANLNFNDVNPFIKKYFSPTAIIKNVMNNLAHCSHFDPENTCVIRFRGTDKELETIQPSYEEMLRKALALKASHPNLRFAVQTDESKFRQYIFDALGGACFLVEHAEQNNYRSSHNYINFYASILLLSKSKFIITTSGNGELWMMLFRGHTKGVSQYLRHKQFIYSKLNPSFSSGQISFWLEH
ncbi:hypothetical protein FD967_01575 [Polynucleobacter sp. JS-Mosq-20-D10]|uniref:DUF6492 family protein n=1 Tax=Polynucleobacter sp. JS-Mosq-20-D10 TaxID=2576922 RepID=UPI001BFE4F00|nr:DUF6492 family protein [Polynucleobacter sp. JS-Mosq-20-D10]QWE00762.1 hypothetical protein FD967_01575 [Polynucleobacter sp. JS-Mosq-20-D10]